MRLGKKQGERVMCRKRKSERNMRKKEQRAIEREIGREREREEGRERRREDGKSITNCTTDRRLQPSACLIARGHFVFTKFILPFFFPLSFTAPVHMCLFFRLWLIKCYTYE